MSPDHYEWLRVRRPELRLPPLIVVPDDVCLRIGELSPAEFIARRAYRIMGGETEVYRSASGLLFGSYDNLLEP